MLLLFVIFLVNKNFLLQQAIKEKDFAKFAETAMKDSNQMHATALDSYPPIVYMNNTSHDIVNFVHRYNKYYGEIKVS